MKDASEDQSWSSFSHTSKHFTRPPVTTGKCCISICLDQQMRRHIWTLWDVIVQLGIQMLQCTCYQQSTGAPHSHAPSGAKYLSFTYKNIFLGKQQGKEKKTCEVLTHSQSSHSNLSVEVAQVRWITTVFAFKTQ